MFKRMPCYPNIPYLSDIEMLNFIHMDSIRDISPTPSFIIEQQKGQQGQKTQEKQNQPSWKSSAKPIPR